MLTETEAARTLRVQQKVIRSGRVSQALCRQMCVDCIYDPAEPGTAKAQIAACTAEDCVLHPVRHLWSADPAQGGSGDDR